MNVIDDLESKLWYQGLKGEVDDSILAYQDKRGYMWDKVNPEHLRYFQKNCCGYPFTNHLALGLMVESNQNLSPKTIHISILSINLVLKGLFKELKLASIHDFDVDTHLSNYLRGEVLPSHSDYKRSFFFKLYKGIVKKVHKWYETKLTDEQKEVFAPFLLPVTYLDSRDFNVEKSAQEAGKSKRRSETDAISKDFIKIRAEGGFRLNQVRRLRQKYLEAVQLVKDNGYPFLLNLLILKMRNVEMYQRSFFPFDYGINLLSYFITVKIILHRLLIMQRHEGLLIQKRIMNSSSSF